MLGYEFQSPELKALEEELRERAERHRQEERERYRELRDEQRQAYWNGRQKEWKRGSKGQPPLETEEFLPHEEELPEMSLSMPSAVPHSQKAMDLTVALLVEYGRDAQAGPTEDGRFLCLNVKGPLPDGEVEDICSVFDRVHRTVQQGYGSEMEAMLKEYRRTHPRRLPESDDLFPP